MYIRNHVQYFSVIYQAAVLYRLEQGESKLLKVYYHLLYLLHVGFLEHVISKSPSNSKRATNSSPKYKTTLQQIWIGSFVTMIRKFEKNMDIEMGSDRI